MRRALTLILPLLMSACNSVVATSNTAADITHRAYNDAIDHWSNVFTYSPPAPPNAPQTRYCYRMQTDVLCYDSVQDSLTAKLVGYQDGEQISWVQPGGGSLGASGAAPSSPRMSNDVQTSPTSINAQLSNINSSPLSTSASTISVSDTQAAAPPTILPKPSAKAKR